MSILSHKLTKERHQNEQSSNIIHIMPYTHRNKMSFILRMTVK